MRPAGSINPSVRVFQTPPVDSLSLSVVGGGVGSGGVGGSGVGGGVFLHGRSEIYLPLSGQYITLLFFLVFILLLFLADVEPLILLRLAGALFDCVRNVTCRIVKTRGNVTTTESVGLFRVERHLKYRP